MLSSGEMQGYIESIGISFSGLVGDVDDAILSINNIIANFSNSNKDEIDSFLTFFKNAFLELPQNIRAFVQIATVEFAHVANVAVIYGQKIANALNPMSPSYNLKGNLDAAVTAYQDSINQILAEREKVTKDATDRRAQAKNDRALNDIVNDFTGQNSGDTLGKYGTKKEPQKDAVDKRKQLKKLKNLLN